MIIFSFAIVHQLFVLLWCLSLLPNQSHGMFLNILGEYKLYELKTSAQHGFSFSISDICPESVRKKDDYSVLKTNVLTYQGANYNLQFLLRLEFSSKVGENVIDLRFTDDSKNTSCLIITENFKKSEPASYELTIKDPSIIANAPSKHYLFYFGKVSLNHGDPLNLGIEFKDGSRAAPKREDLTNLRNGISCPGSIMSYTCMLMYDENYLIEFYPFPRQHDSVTHRLGLNGNLREPFKGYFDETKAEFVYKIRNITTIDRDSQIFLNTTLESPNNNNPCKKNEIGNYCLCNRKCISCFDFYKNEFEKSTLEYRAGSACTQWPLNQISFRSHRIMTDPFLGQILNTETSNIHFKNLFPKIIFHIERTSKNPEEESEFNITISLNDNYNIGKNERLNFKISLKTYRLCERESDNSERSKPVGITRVQKKPYEKYNLEGYEKYELDSSEIHLRGFDDGKYVFEFIPHFNEEICQNNTNKSDGSLCPYMDEATRTIKCEPCNRYLQTVTISKFERSEKIHSTLLPLLRIKNLNQLLTEQPYDELYLLSPDFELALKHPNASGSLQASKCAFKMKIKQKEGKSSMSPVLYGFIVFGIGIAILVALALTIQKSFGSKKMSDKNYTTTHIVVYLSIEISNSDLERLRVLTIALFDELKKKMNYISYEILDRNSHHEKNINSCLEFDRAHFIIYVFNNDYELNTTPNRIRIGKKRYNDEYNLLMNTSFYKHKLIYITFRNYIKNAMQARASSSPSISSATSNSTMASSTVSSPKYMPRMAAPSSQSSTSETSPLYNLNSDSVENSQQVFNMKDDISDFVRYLMKNSSLRFSNRDKFRPIEKQLSSRIERSILKRVKLLWITWTLRKTLERVQKEQNSCTTSNASSEQTELTMELR